jgi:dTDP-4-amino-4,6-dideoxygalactose transaminase
VKTVVEDLAILGGTPAFGIPMHVGRPNIGRRQRFQERVDDVLDRNWLTNNGTYVRAFERKVAEVSGVRHAVAMCNGTVALEIAVKALGLSGEVILPSFTFVATAHALQWLAITPVFCDIDAVSHNIDPRKIERLITPRTTGILGVHLWGRPCEVEALSELAARYRLKLLFDAAHALGCSYKGRMIGGFGDAEVFSFHATKIVNALEGGAVVTNDPDLAERLRLMRNFGFSNYDRTDCIGSNGKMNEVAAAMGLTNLECLQEFIALNRSNFRKYHEQLSGIDGISLAGYDEGEENNFQYIVVEIDQDRTAVSRDQIVQILHAENVLVRRYFHPGCHRLEPYRSLTPAVEIALPETEKLSDRVLCFPTGTSIGAHEIEAICGILRFVVAHGHRIKSEFLTRKIS